MLPFTLIVLHILIFGLLPESLIFCLDLASLSLEFFSDFLPLFEHFGLSFYIEKRPLLQRLRSGHNAVVLAGVFLTLVDVSDLVIDYQSEVQWLDLWHLSDAKSSVIVIF